MVMHDSCSSLPRASRRGGQVTAMLALVLLLLLGDGVMADSAYDTYYEDPSATSDHTVACQSYVDAATDPEAEMLYVQLEHVGYLSRQIYRASECADMVDALKTAGTSNDTTDCPSSESSWACANYVISFEQADLTRCRTPPAATCDQMVTKVVRMQSFRSGPQELCPLTDYHLNFAVAYSTLWYAGCTPESADFIKGSLITDRMYDVLFYNDYVSLPAEYIDTLKIPYMKEEEIKAYAPASLGLSFGRAGAPFTVLGPKKGWPTSPDLFAKVCQDFVSTVSVAGGSYYSLPDDVFYQFGRLINTLPKCAPLLQALGGMGCPTSAVSWSCASAFLATLLDLYYTCDPPAKPATCATIIEAYSYTMYFHTGQAVASSCPEADYYLNFAAAYMRIAYWGCQDAADASGFPAESVRFNYTFTSRLLDKDVAWDLTKFKDPGVDLGQVNSALRKALFFPGTELRLNNAFPIPAATLPRAQLYSEAVTAGPLEAGVVTRVPITAPTPPPTAGPPASSPGTRGLPPTVGEGPIARTPVAGAPGYSPSPRAGAPVMPATSPTAVGGNGGGGAPATPPTGGGGGGSTPGVGPAGGNGGGDGGNSAVAPDGTGQGQFGSPGIVVIDGSCVLRAAALHVVLALAIWLLFC